MGRKHQRKKEQSAKHRTLEYQGVLEITRSGIGYVTVTHLEHDVLVRPNDFNTALHGDTVRVAITSDPHKLGRYQGKVMEVLKRKQVDFIGHIEMGKAFPVFIADTDKPIPDIVIPLEELSGAQHLERVLVRLTAWERNKRPFGKVVQVLKAEDENEIAMKEILLEGGFSLLFPDEVIEESLRIPETLPEDEITRRKDCREVLTFTIDPVDARDFDDALSIRLLRNGNYEIGVHIADVAHYVPEGSHLDQEAYNRATSVYLPDRVSPMLPERISNELCSLRPHEDKFTFSVLFEITRKGEVVQNWMGKTVIHSDHRFTYEEVQEIIEQEAGLYKDELFLLNEWAQHFRKLRFRKGAINFSSQEVRFKLDEKGRPIGIIIKESKEAHQLVEEFMLLANRTVAEHIGKDKSAKKEIPFPYRVHDTPDEMKLMPFVAFARKYGHGFEMKSPESIAASFNQMLKEAKGKPEQHVLEQLGIRTMAKAIYTTENIGHYGLGFKYYCHFTSPIRRYPDILVHRILDECLKGKTEPHKKLEPKCKHCSEKERAAMDAERAANKYKQVEYMKNYLGEEFEGVISGVAGFGFWVETVEHKCEGLVSLSSLSDYDDFRLVESDYALVGHRSGKKFRMGDKITIKVIAANLNKRQLDYEWVITRALAEAHQQPAPHSGKVLPFEKFRNKPPKKSKQKHKNKK